MSSLEEVRMQRQEILALAAQHGARNIRVFGSVARGTADASSDIDILVDLESGRSLVDLGQLLTELSDLLGDNVDVVTASGLRGRLKDRVLAEAVSL
ncbi:MAG: nucleotidyltransferase family protein [Tepidiformaceae bacterium]